MESNTKSHLSPTAHSLLARVILVAFKQLYLWPKGRPQTGRSEGKSLRLPGCLVGTFVNVSQLVFNCNSGLGLPSRLRCRVHRAFRLQKSE